ncbi:carcinine transporter [Lycorma delicatula]|uniref:carcinine transporter n=1 Tax=Lycorma delicatula TaxID=130591 RepID=UPI003F510650
MAPQETLSVEGVAKTVAQEHKSQTAPANTEKKQPIDFDDVLPHLGEFGRYQKLLFLMMIPFAFFVAWVYFTQIFITLVPEQHWCRVPELQNLPIELRKSLSIPKTKDGFSKCTMYVADWKSVIAQGLKEADPSWPTTSCSQGWEYDFSDIPYSTIATELDWVCENDSLPTVAQSVFFCGAILGGLLFGWMADRFGRIPALVGSNMAGLVAGICTAFCSTFWQFLVCRFLVGLAFDNCFTMMYILVLEYVGPKWRTFVANMSIAIFFTAAASILPWIAYWLADWGKLCIVTSAPLILALFAPIFIPESARWLVSQGKIDKAMRIMKKFEKFNGTHVDQKIYDDFSESCEALKKEEEAGKSYSVIDLFRSKRLCRITIILIFIWMAISLVFDGHVRNVGSLGLDVFVTFTIASATELPADTLLTLTLDHWGRRWLACGTMVVSGIFSLLATLVPTGVPSATLAIMGRFSVNISYNIGLQYAAELLPTVVRAQGVALIHIMGYVASILSPFVIYLANFNPSFPLLVLGVMGIIGGVLTLFLPETMDQELPQTLQDGEEFGKDQKFFDIPCRKRQNSKSESNFKRSTTRVSVRASVRGEQFRSSLINRSSQRKNNNTVVDNA